MPQTKNHTKILCNNIHAAYVPYYIKIKTTAECPNDCNLSGECMRTHVIMWLFFMANEKVYFNALYRKLYNNCSHVKTMFIALAWHRK